MTTANQVSTTDTTSQHVHDNGMGMGSNGGASGGGMNHMMMMVKKNINKHAYARNNNKKQIFKFVLCI